MDVRLKIADKSDFFIIKNFIPLFRHYIAEVYNELPNQYGVFSYDDDRTLQELCDKREVWLEKPDELYPFIIFAFDRPVGYALISKVAPDSYIKSDYFINALFIVQPARRKGIAMTAVKRILDMFHGRWELHTSSSDRNSSTQMFWRRFITECTNGKFEEFIDKMPDGDEKIIFRFNN